MNEDKLLYYVDSIHDHEELYEGGRNMDNYEVHVSLLPVDDDNGTNSILVPVPKHKLLFENGRKLAENNFVYFNPDNQTPFENGNRDSRALSLIRQSSFLRKTIRDYSLDKQIQLFKKGDFNESRITSFHVNVGHGNCSILLIERGHSYWIWMVDCGTSYYVHSPHLENIDDCFVEISHRLNVPVNLLHVSLFMLTHLHSDHYNGIGKLFNSGYCDSNTAFLINLDYAVANPQYVRILELINQNKCIVNTPLRNIDLSSDGMSIPAILFPDRRVYKNKPSYKSSPYYVESKANNSSVVYIIEGSNKNMMFPGDMENKELRMIQEKGNFILFLHRANYYCVSHHASATGHLICECSDSKHICRMCLNCCKNGLQKAIVMGHDGAFPGVYSPTVITDFGQDILFSERDAEGNSVKCLIIDWKRNIHSYLY